MEFSDVIQNRYACKKFDGTPVAKEALDAILAAGRLAPTAKNLQEQHVYVIQSEEGLKKIDELTPCRYGAVFESVMCDAEAELLPAGGEKQRALQILMKTQTGRDFAITPEMAEGVAVIRLRAVNLSAKARRA